MAADSVSKANLTSSLKVGKHHIREHHASAALLSQQSHTLPFRRRQIHWPRESCTDSPLAATNHPLHPLHTRPTNTSAMRATQILLGGGGKVPYPKHVWSPAGGWYSRPDNWKQNTAVMGGVALLITGLMWNLSAQREHRYRMPEVSLSLFSSERPDPQGKGGLEGVVGETTSSHAAFDGLSVEKRDMSLSRGSAWTQTQSLRNVPLHSSQTVLTRKYKQPDRFFPSRYWSRQIREHEKARLEGREGPA